MTARLLAALLYLAAAVPTAAQGLVPDKSPEEAWEGFRRAAEAGDNDAIWGSLAKSAKEYLVEGRYGEWIDGRLKLGQNEWNALAKECGTTPDRISALKLEEVVGLRVAAQVRGIASRAVFPEFVVCERGADRVVAMLRETENEHRIQEFYLVLEREDHTWKLGGETFRAFKAEDLCRERVRDLGSCLERYLETKGKPPAALDDLTDFGRLSEFAGKTFPCPCGKPEEPGYVYLYPLRTDRQGTIVIYDAHPHPVSSRRRIVLLGGDILWMPEDRFRKELAYQLAPLVPELEKALDETRRAAGTSSGEEHDALLRKVASLEAALAQEKALREGK